MITALVLEGSLPYLVVCLAHEEAADSVDDRYVFQVHLQPSVRCRHLKELLLITNYLEFVRVTMMTCCSKELKVLFPCTNYLKTI